MRNTKRLPSLLVMVLAFIGLGLVFITHPGVLVVFSADGLKTAWTCGWNDMDCIIREAEAARKPALCGLLNSGKEDLCIEEVSSRLPPDEPKVRP